MVREFAFQGTICGLSGLLDIYTTWRRRVVVLAQIKGAS